MNEKAKAINTLYLAHFITLEGVRQAVKDNIITEEDFLKITGEQYN